MSNLSPLCSKADMPRKASTRSPEETFRASTSGITQIRLKELRAVAGAESLNTGHFSRSRPSGNNGRSQTHLATVRCSVLVCSSEFMTLFGPSGRGPMCASIAESAAPWTCAATRLVAAWWSVPGGSALGVVILISFQVYATLWRLK
jgi:hypothetical protein